jgi:hypothetical protein
MNKHVCAACAVALITLATHATVQAAIVEGYIDGPLVGNFKFEPFENDLPPDLSQFVLAPTGRVDFR